MTIFPICLKCRHLNPSHQGPMRCTAFPARIPDPILLMDHDHRNAYPGDQGIRYEPSDAAAAAIEPQTK